MPKEKSKQSINLEALVGKTVELMADGRSFYKGRLTEVRGNFEIYKVENYSFTLGMVQKISHRGKRIIITFS